MQAICKYGTHHNDGLITTYDHIQQETKSLYIEISDTYDNFLKIFDFSNKEFLFVLFQQSFVATQAENKQIFL